jgi:hypothetical protein
VGLSPPWEPTHLYSDAPLCTFQVSVVINGRLTTLKRKARSVDTLLRLCRIKVRKPYRCPSQETPCKPCLPIPPSYLWQYPALMAAAYRQLLNVHREVQGVAHALQGLEFTDMRGKHTPSTSSLQLAPVGTVTSPYVVLGLAGNVLAASHRFPRRPSAAVPSCSDPHAHVS